jgi:uncharacterized protein YkwD
MLAVATILLTVALLPVPARAVSLINDPDQYDFAQQYLLLQINRERTHAGQKKVRLDALAGQAAKQHADEMLAGGYFSHWNAAGIKPTRRYNLLGGYDAVGENIYYASNHKGGLQDLLDGAIATLMASEGHRKTLLGANYTHVGLGLASSADGKQFYLVQEFVARLGGEYSFPLSAKLGSQPVVSGRFDPAVYEFAQLVVGYEEPARPRDALWLNRTAEYRDGDALLIGFTPQANLRFEGMETSHEIQVDARAGRFSCAVPLDYKHKPGTYYVFVWLKKRGGLDGLLAATAAIEVQR